MLWEDMITEGLAITRAVHDRYHSSRRNPWNEIECGDHYARSMASYGVFLAACGFEYHGPKGHIGFTPRLTPEHFKAAFSSAAGWGTYEQMANQKGLNCALALKWGDLHLRSFSVKLPEMMKPASVRVFIDNRPARSKFALAANRLTVVLAADANLKSGNTLQIKVA
jgi:hypothetical protein